VERERERGRKKEKASVTTTALNNGQFSSSGQIMTFTHSD